MSKLTFKKQPAEPDHPLQDRPLPEAFENRRSSRIPIRRIRPLIVLTPGVPAGGMIMTVSPGLILLRNPQ
jgi:hypothetical protein